MSREGEREWNVFFHPLLCSFTFCHLILNFSSDYWVYFSCNILLQFFPTPHPSLLFVPYHFFFRFLSFLFTVILFFFKLSCLSLSVRFFSLTFFSFFPFLSIILSLSSLIPSSHKTPLSVTHLLQERRLFGREEEGKERERGRRDKEESQCSHFLPLLSLLVYSIFCSPCT